MPETDPKTVATSEPPKADGDANLELPLHDPSFNNMNPEDLEKWLGQYGDNPCGWLEPFMPADSKETPDQVLKSWSKQDFNV